MRTTCPECRTTFRVGQTQLSARRGLVRCGHCQAVFNAYDTLLPELEEPPFEDAGTAVGTTAPRERLGEMPVAAPLAADAPADLDASPQAEAGPEATPLETDTGETLAAMATEAAAEAERANERQAGIDAEAVAAAEASVDADVAPEVVENAKASEETSESILLTQLPHRLPPAPRARPLWRSALLVLASLLLLAALLTQIAYFLRTQLVTAMPASRPALNALCEVLGCRVPLPRQLDKRALVSSSLEHDPEQKSRVRLTFLLANRSGQTQAWPHVVLTLSDLRQAPVGRQVFKPASYLPAAAEVAAGMAAEAEREVRLELDIGNLAASGYALDLVYP